MDSPNVPLLHSRISTLESQNTALKAELATAHETHQLFTVKHIGCDLALDTLRTENAQLREEVEEVRKRREGEGVMGERSGGEVEEGLRAEIEVLRAVIEESRISADRAAGQHIAVQPIANVLNGTTHSMTNGVAPPDSTESPNIRLQLETLRQSYDSLLSTHRELETTHAESKRHEDTIRERQMVHDALNTFEDPFLGGSTKTGQTVPERSGRGHVVEPGVHTPQDTFRPEPRIGDLATHGTTNGHTAGKDKSFQASRSPFSTGPRRIAVSRTPGADRLASFHSFGSSKREEVQSISSNEETVEGDTVGMPEVRNGSKDTAAPIPQKASTSARTRMILSPPAPPKQGPPLTLEIHTLIGGYLAGANAYASLAAYSTTSKTMRRTLLGTLFETVVWEGDKSVEQAFGIKAGSGKLVFPTGLGHTKYLFLGKSREADVERVIGKHDLEVKKDPHFLRHVFPDLRLHAVLQPASGTSESQAVLTIHDAVSSDTLHSLLTSVRFRGGGIQRIKSIHCQQDARIIGGARGERCYHRDREHSLSIRFRMPLGREGNRRTVREVLRFLESPDGVPQVDERQVTVRFVVTFPGVYQVLVNSLAALLPISAYNLHIRIILVCSGSNRSFSDIQTAFTEAVEMYARRWSSIPLARRNTTKKDSKVLPMLRLEASTADGTEVVGTITALPGKKGRKFEADLQGKGSWKGRGKKHAQPLSKVYPAVYADGVKVS